jgi:3-deoxy-D-manno-octulosonic-acid transferase
VPGISGRLILRVRMSGPMYLLYSALLAIAMLLSTPYWLFQMGRRKKYRKGLGERFGRFPQRLQGAYGRKQPVVWVHAVSVGEVLAVSRLVHEAGVRLPQHRIVVSTVTDTGQQLAREKFGAENVFYFPLDFAFAIYPYLKQLRPELVVIAETEFWPNFLRLSHGSGAKIAVVNGRISDRSWVGYRRVRPFLRNVLEQIDLYLAQTEQDRKRLVDIGAPEERVQVSGNLKYDLSPPRRADIVFSLRSSFEKTAAGPVIVAGSTMEGEESLLLRAFEIVRGSQSRAVMIIAPRHPQRFQQVADFVKSLGIPLWRRSLWSGEDLGGAVLLLDTIGELASVYELADVAFVGGSLIEHGGHNILEPAQHGVPVVIGPHYANFREMVDLFRGMDAVRVVGPAELPLCMLELLSHEDERIALGRRGLAALQTQTGATKRTLDALQSLLPVDHVYDSGVSGKVAQTKTAPGPQ